MKTAKTNCTTCGKKVEPSYLAMMQHAIQNHPEKVLERSLEHALQANIGETLRGIGVTFAQSLKGKR